MENTPNNAANKRAKIHKFVLSNDVVDIDYERFGLDPHASSKRCKFYGPTRSWVLTKADTNQAYLKLQYNSMRITLDDIELRYDESNGKIFIILCQHLWVSMSCPCVDTQGQASMEFSPKGKLTFSIPITGTEQLPGYKIYHEKSRPMNGKKEVFKSWNDVD